MNYQYDIRCHSCGKFISTQDQEARCYSRYGRSYDLEPPDEEYICGSCWSKKTTEDIARLERVCWIKPQRWAVEV